METRAVSVSSEVVVVGTVFAGAAPLRPGGDAERDEPHGASVGDDRIAVGVIGPDRRTAVARAGRFRRVDTAEGGIDNAFRH